MRRSKEDMILNPQCEVELAMAIWNLRRAGISYSQMVNHYDLPTDELKRLRRKAYRMVKWNEENLNI